MNPRVLVCAPTTSAKRYALGTWLWTLQHLMYPFYDVLIADNTDDNGEYAQLLTRLGAKVIRSPILENPYEQVTAARNALRLAAINGKYDYLLFVESDVIPPRDIIERLLNHRTDFVTTVQYNHFVRGNTIERFISLSRRSTEPGPRHGRFYNLTDADLPSSNIVRVLGAEGGLGGYGAEKTLITVDRAHSGCTIIAVHLLRDLPFRNDNNQGNDYLLSDDLRARGITLYCDTTIPICHVTCGSTHVVRKNYRRKK